MPLIIVERSFEPPLEDADRAGIDQRMAACLAVHEQVRYLGSFFSLDRRRMICRYDAPDAESVRHVQHTAKAPFERVWAARILGEPT